MSQVVEGSRGQKTEDRGQDLRGTTIKITHYVIPNQDVIPAKAGIHDSNFKFFWMPDRVRHDIQQLKKNIFKKPFTISACILVAFLLITVCQGVAFAQAKVEPKKPEAAKSEAKKAEPTAPKFNVGDFTYTSANRRDPFEAVSLSNLKETGKGASSKRGYELEELKLVGIMRAGNTNIAMMEDMKGRGLLFKKNDYLNKNLWIVNIIADKVEFGYKIKGEIKTFTIDIPRKKEGM